VARSYQYSHTNGSNHIFVFVFWKLVGRQIPKSRSYLCQNPYYSWSCHRILQYQ